MSRLAIVIAVGALCAGLAAAGCGSDEQPGGALATLSSQLPADTPLIDATDVDSARADLGLERDADATDAKAAFAKGVSAHDPLQRLIRDTSIGFAALGERLKGAGDYSAIDALDGSRIHAVASTGPGSIQVSAISTSQSFDSVADALVDAGYTRDGNVVSAPSSTQLIGAAADAGDGVIILARSEPLARDTASGRSGPQQLAARLDSVDGPVKTAAKEMDCVAYLAAGQAADGSSGELVVGVDGDADPARVDADKLAATDPDVEFSEPKAEADRLTIDYSGPAPEVDHGTALEGLAQTFGVYSAYNCK